MKNSKKIKRRIGDVLRILILLVALSVLLYPTISNKLYDKNSSKVISIYDDTSEKMEKKNRRKLIKKARAYNEELLKKADMLEPFSSKKKDSDKWYHNLLNVDGSGMMGYIEIPSINVKLPIYHGTDETVLQVGVGHFEGTSLPVGGKGSHAVLTGHRGLVSKNLFIDVDKLTKGDVFYVQVLNYTLAYEVDQILTVLPNETDALSIVPKKDYVTLVSCTPYGVNTHRLLIRAHRIPYEQAKTIVKEQPVTEEVPLYTRALIGGLACIGIIFVVVLLYMLIRRRKQRRGGKDEA